MLRVEIADNPHSWEKGLMFKKELEANSGMLFKFNKPNILKFWGLNTYIPLDIAFISEDNKIKKIMPIKPLSLSSVSSEDKCLCALEANSGFFVKNNIKVGDSIELKKDDTGHIIIFKKTEGK